MEVLLERAATLGLGALIAVIVLLWKRADDKEHALQLAKMEERNNKIIEANIKAMQELTIVVHGLVTMSSLVERLEKEIARQIGGRQG